MATQRKRPVSIRSALLEETNEIKFFAFDHVTEKVVDGMTFRVDVNKVNPVLHRYAILDGVKDSIRDAGALGAESTLKQKFDAMRERADYLTSGATSWTRSGPRESADMVLLMRALMREDDTRDGDKLRAVLVNWTRDKVSAMLRSERLAEIVDQLRAEDGKGIDTDSLFDELDN